MKHSEVDIDIFWISMQKEFPALAEKALLVLLQFSTSYLCELGFSTLNDIKIRIEKDYVPLKNKCDNTRHIRAGCPLKFQNKIP